MGASVSAVHANGRRCQLFVLLSPSTASAMHFPNFPAAAAFLPKTPGLGWAVKINPIKKFALFPDEVLARPPRIRRQEGSTRGPQGPRGTYDGRSAPPPPPPSSSEVISRSFAPSQNHIHLPSTIRI